MPPLYKPVTVKFTSEGMTQLDDYVKEQVQSLINSHKELHEQKIPKWRDWYAGTPNEKFKSFPWENASNLVIQIIGTYVDMLKARVLGTTYEIMPLIVAGLVGDWEPQEQGEEQREAIEEFMNYVGLEPTELDLYRVEGAVVSDSIKFG